MSTSHLKYLLFGLLLAAAGAAQAQLVNGGFQTGDFTGWTFYNTSTGIQTGGSYLFQVTPFDIVGNGMTPNTGEFEVGEISGGAGGGGLGQGIGIYQFVDLGAGELSASFNVAATSPGNNADAGTFQLLLDGNVVATDALGGIGVGQTLRSSVSYSGMITAGSHEFDIEIRRGYGAGQGNTPYEFLGNIQLGVTPVPEPSTAALIGLGFGVFAIAVRRGQREVRKPGRS